MNPFPNPGKFALSIQQDVILPITKDGKQVFDKVNKSELAEAFICTKEFVPLNVGEHVIVPLHFLPLYMGLHVCRLLFVDEKIGEFVIEVDVR